MTVSKLNEKSDELNSRFVHSCVHELYKLIKQYENYNLIHCSSVWNQESLYLSKLAAHWLICTRQTHRQSQNGYSSKTDSTEDGCWEEPELSGNAGGGQAKHESNRTDCKGSLRQGLCSWICSQGTRLNTQMGSFMLPCFCSPETPSKHRLLCSPSQPRTQCVCLDVLDPTMTLSASVSPTSYHVLTMVS